MGSNLTSRPSTPQFSVNASRPPIPQFTVTTALTSAVVTHDDKSLLEVSILPDLLRSLRAEKWGLQIEIEHFIDTVKMKVSVSDINEFQNTYQNFLQHLTCLKDKLTNIHNADIVSEIKELYSRLNDMSKSITNAYSQWHESRTCTTPHISPTVTQDIWNYEDTDIQPCDSASNADTMSISSSIECKKIALVLEKRYWSSNLS